MRANIYVSATFQDLVEHREAVREAIRALDHVDVSMEHYVAEPKRPLVRCLDDVRRCDLYLGIFGHRYGYVPPGSDRSITEQEYRAALKHGKDVICFLRRDDGSAPADEPETSVARLRAVRDEISTSYLAGFFSTPDELATRASAAIVRALRLDTTPVDEEREHRLIREWRQGATRMERARARQALVNMASPRYAAAIKDLLLQAQDVEQIAAWLGELLTMSVTSRQVMPVLADLLHAGSADTRAFAVFQIGELGLRGKEIHPQIVRQIVPLRDDPHPEVRMQLAHTLGKIHHAEETLPLVRGCLEALAQDESAEVRMRAEESQRLTA